MHVGHACNHVCFDTSYSTMRFCADQKRDADADEREHAALRHKLQLLGLHGIVWTTSCPAPTSSTVPSERYGTALVGLAGTASQAATAASRGS